MKKLPMGRRPADENHMGHVWRFGLVVRRNPVLVAFTLSLLISGIALFFVISAVQDLRSTQEDLQATQSEQKAQAVRIAGVAVDNQLNVAATAESRVQALTLLCTQNDVMLLILRKNSGAIGSNEAIDALTAVNCQDLLAKAVQQADDARKSANLGPPLIEHGNP